MVWFGFFPLPATVGKGFEQGLKLNPKTCTVTGIGIDPMDINRMDVFHRETPFLIFLANQGTPGREASPILAYAHTRHMDGWVHAWILPPLRTGSNAKTLF